MNTSLVRYGNLSVEMSTALAAVVDGDPYGGLLRHRERLGRGRSLNALIRRGLIQVGPYMRTYLLTEYGRGVMAQRRQISL